MPEHRAISIRTYVQIKIFLIDFNSSIMIILEKERSFDVFAGVDVFGRGTFGGGGLNTFQSVQGQSGFIIFQGRVS